VGGGGKFDKTTIFYLKDVNKLVACVCLSCVLHGKKESKQVGSMCVFVMCLTWEERIKTNW
jgi:hypothetical protein